VTKGGAMVGRTTSGGHGWRTRQSLALAMVKPELAAVGTEVEISVLGEKRRAIVVPESPYDPDNAALRA
jgi:dimethylglycine dehydrogenase